MALAALTILVNLVNGNQFFIGDVPGYGVGFAVVSVVHAVGFLAQIVLRIAVVSAPTVDVEGGELRTADFLSYGGDVGLYVQGYEIIAQAVRKELLENVRGVQSGLAGALNVIVSNHGKVTP